MRGKIPFDPHIIIFLYTEEIMFKKGVVPSQGLRIIIVGCGKVGRTLVEQLGKEGHGHNNYRQKQGEDFPGIQYL